MEDEVEMNGSLFKMAFDDALYKKQWYLVSLSIEKIQFVLRRFKENEGQLKTPANHDINVIPAWLAGYSGKDVIISIIDDGLDHKHPELTEKYVSVISKVFFLHTDRRITLSI